MRHLIEEGRWAACDSCGTLSAEEASRCSTCGGKGSIPLCPPISEWVVWRRPLTQVEIEYQKKDPEAYPPIPSLKPMLVVRATRIRGGGMRCCVHVHGYVWDTPTEPKEHELCDGTVISEPARPQVRWVEAKGPSPEPGCWDWKGEPR